MLKRSSYFEMKNWVGQTVPFNIIMEHAKTKWNIMMTTRHIMKSYCDAKCKCDKIIEHYSIVWSIVIQRSYEVIMHKM